MANNIDKVIMPNPPALNKINITHWPKCEKKVGVSFTIKPVTQVALVAVKMASTSPILSGPLVDRGKLKRIVPIIMATKKLIATTCGGFNLFFIYYLTNVSLAIFTSRLNAFSSLTAS